MINKLTIIGVGLIGGSLAKALKAQDYCPSITGYSRREKNLKIAKNMGVIDHWTTDLVRAISGADVVVMATPVASFEAILLAIAPILSTKTLLTDVGSVKANILALVRQTLGDKAGQFIAGHPIAGKEKNGITASDEALFSGKKVILTPSPSNQEKDIEYITAMWQVVGANVVQMSAKRHDDILSATSHLPHILAFGLMDYLIAKDKNVCDYAAGGFKDFSRIASSDATMWTDICLANKSAILQSIEDYQNTLDKISHLIKTNDKKTIYQLFKQAKIDRDNWLKKTD